MLKDQISGNKSPLWSIDVSIDRVHPDAQYVKFLHILVDFDERGWPSK
jgi:hypothetical protein